MLRRAELCDGWREGDHLPNGYHGTFIRRYVSTAEPSSVQQLIIHINSFYNMSERFFGKKVKPRPMGRRQDFSLSNH